MRVQQIFQSITAVLPGLSSLMDPSFPIVKAEVAYKRYLTLTQRDVQFPDGRVISWDVVGHAVPAQPTYSVVFPFFSDDNTTTLVREYAQGPNKMVYTFPAGVYERKKSASIQESAASELSEEARLTGGTWIRLLPEANTDGIFELKWCTNAFQPFLVVDPVRDAHPGQRDEEEFIRIHDRVPIKKLKELIMAGELMLPSVQTAIMALNALKERGYLQESGLF